MLSVRGQIAASLVDPTAQPLPKGEGIVGTVRKHRANGLRRAESNQDCGLRFAGENDMNSCRVPHGSKLRIGGVNCQSSRLDARTLQLKDGGATVIRARTERSAAFMPLQRKSLQAR